MSQSIYYLNYDLTGNYDFHITANIKLSFRARKSITKAAVNFIGSKIKSVDKDEPCVEMLIDMSKNFDSIDH